MKIDKKSYRNNDIYYIGYITIKNIDDYENIHSVNLLHLIIDKADGFIKESNGNKYLVFPSTNKTKEVMTKYAEFWNEIKYLIQTINVGKAGE